MGNPVEEICKIAQNNYSDIISEIVFPEFSNKLRIILIDRSFIDVYISLKIRNRFDFHWERRHIDNIIFRYDNFPDVKWKKIKTFPFHFHFKRDVKVVEPNFSKNPISGFKDFMSFIRKYLETKQ